MAAEGTLALPRTAPRSTLAQADGTPVELAAFWHAQPLLVIFLRHVGCAVCREHLHAIRDAYGALRDAGGEVVAISRSVPLETTIFSRRNRLPFTVLADPSGNVYRGWGFVDGTLGEAIGPRVAVAQALQALQGRLPYALPGHPIKQLGGTAIVDREGVLRFYHLARPIYNYPPVKAYLDVLARL
jgi:peroxiredoxin